MQRKTPHMVTPSRRHRSYDTPHATHGHAESVYRRRCVGANIDVVLKILPPAVQHILKIPLEGAFLAQGRINAPPIQQHAA